MSTITSSTSTPPKVSVSNVSADKTAVVSSTASDAEKESPSVTLSLSDYAQKRMAVMREATAKLRDMQARQQEERKNLARQRLEDIKKRIEMLKQLVAALGLEAAKGVLRQIKQLAQELGQAASVLKEPSGASTSTLGSGAQASSADDEGVQTVESTTAVEAASEVLPEVEADPETVPAGSAAVEPAGKEADVAEGTDAEADEQSETAMQRARSERDERQRRADGEELKKVAAQLKQLLAMVKAQLAAKPDKETEKMLGEINDQLATVDKATNEMSGIGAAISVSIGATVSITV